MKYYKSEYYKINGSPVELYYDNINNEPIADEEYPCLYFENGINGWEIEICKVKSFFVASDDKGIGVCSEYKDKRFVTYYEDEEWCGIFSLLEDLDFYDSYAKSQIIRDTITYNIFMINNELDGKATILDQVPNIKIRNRDKELIGIALEGHFMCDKSGIHLILNKIVSNDLNKLDSCCITMSVGVDEIVLSVENPIDKDSIIGCAMKTKLPIDRRFDDFLKLVTLNLNTSGEEPELDDSVEDIFEELNLTYKEKHAFIYDNVLNITKERKDAIDRLKKTYHIFDRNIDLITYLLS